MAEETFSQRYATGDSNTAGAFGFDLVSGVDYAISKCAFGDANTITRVTASVGLPVALLAGSAAIGKLAANDGVDIGDVTINNASGASAVNIQDGGNSITIDGSLTNISGTISLPTGAATAAKQPALGTAGTASSDVITVQGIASMTALKVDGSAVTQPVSGTFWQATQPVSLTSTTITGTVAVTQSGTWDEVGINDSGNSITVDAPVGTPVYVRLSDGAAAISTLPVSLASVPSHAVTNAGTFATQATLQAGTAYAAKMRLTDGTTDAEVVPLTGYNAQAVAIVDGSGDQITSFGGGTQYTEDAAAAANPVGNVQILVRSDAPGGISDTDGDNVAQRGTNYGAAYVTILSNAGTSVDFSTETTLSALNAKVTACNTGAVTISAALPAGTNAIGKLAANSGVDIGDIDVTSIIPGTGATNLGKAEDGAHTSGDVGVMVLGVQNASPTNLAGSAGDYEPFQISDGRVWTSTVVTGSVTTAGAAAHDSAISGNPTRVAGRAETALSGITLVADGDTTDLYAGVDGVQIVRTHTNLEDIVTATPVAITDGSSTSVISAQGSGIKTYLTSVTIANSSATFVTVDLRDGTAGSVKWTFPVPATGGVTHKFDPPLPFSANTAVAADPSASASTITVSAMGFKSKV